MRPIPPRQRELLSTDALKTPLGLVYVVMSGESVAEIAFDNPHLRHSEIPEQVKRELLEYLDGRRTEFTVGIKLLSGTEFERDVWLALRKIPYGETRSYKWIAEMVGRPNGSRAVGQALARNPIPIILPCHRVIESCGRLGGYTPGSDIKRRLLQIEYYVKEGRKP